MKLNILTLFFGLAVLFSNCSDEETDPCSGITCLNGGTCVNGVCQCPERYTGVSCGEQATPVKIKISKIEITKFPATDTDGAGWDLTSGPDIIPGFVSGSEVSYAGDKYFTDAQQGKTYGFEFTPWLEITDVTENYNIVVLDYDEPDSDDIMGGISFVPYSSTNDFPSVLVLDADGPVAFKLHVIYEFE